MAQRSQLKRMEIANPNAAGIDVGSASHFVSVPPDRDDEPVREFKSFTEDLERLADWLVSCGIDTVAMESTGVYWISHVQRIRQLIHVRVVTLSTPDSFECKVICDADGNCVIARQSRGTAKHSVHQGPTLRRLPQSTALPQQGALVFPCEKRRCSLPSPELDASAMNGKSYEVGKSHAGHRSDVLRAHEIDGMKTDGR
ncbi:hypothetical protein K6W12_24990 [Burkholderia multivorans]|nr:hypothetical protein [Burkholderia multivorans]